MSERRYPVARVRLYEPGRRYVQRFDGFGRYDVVADLWRNERVTSNTVDPSSLGVGAGAGHRAEVPAAMVVDHDKLDVTICRPFLDTTQSVGLEHFDYYGGHWLPLEGLGMGDEARLYQYDGRGTAPTGAVSKFTLPRNPVLCVSLYRAAPSPSHDWSENPPCTEIQLGVGTTREWAIVFPYGGAAFFMRRTAGQWERIPNTGRGTRLRSIEGYGPGERLLVWIAVWRGKFVVSTDGFADDIWVCPTGPECVEVPEGKVGLWHNAGQWAFSVLPIKMTTATLDCSPIEAGYDTSACAGETFVQASSAPVRDDEGSVLADVEVTDSTDMRSDLTDFERAWRAVLTPHVHVYSDPAFETAVSPELHAVQLGQFPEIVDTGLQAWDEISDDIEGVAGHVTNDGRASTYQLSVDNSLGQYADLREYRRCSLEIGWTLAGGGAEYAPAVTGYVVEPDPAVLPGPQDRMEVVVIDPMVRLRDEKSEGRAPVFDGWLVRDVFEWVLDRCGLPSDVRDLEDTGTRLSRGAFDRALWRVEPGRSWGEFLREVAEFDYEASIFFDSEGTFQKACRFCQEARTAENVMQHDGSASGACGSTVRWELYTRQELAGIPGSDGAILSIERPRKSLHSLEFANHVAVCGLGVDGMPVRSVVFEPASLYDPNSDMFVGWRKMEVSALETYTSQAEVNRLAQELFRDRAKRPEHVVILTPLEPNMKIGDVIRVNGGERVGADGHKYRIEGIRHRLRRRPREIATTQVIACWLREGA